MIKKNLKRIEEINYSLDNIEFKLKQKTKISEKIVLIKIKETLMEELKEKLST